MTRDEVIAMAEQAGLWIPMADHDARVIMVVERFASMVAAAEREACAKVAEWSPSILGDNQAIAAAIRARGEK